MREDKERILLAMGKKLGLEKEFKEQIELVRQNCCPLCGLPIDKDSFRDSLSQKEFEISGICQKCQDKTFGR